MSAASTPDWSTAALPPLRCQASIARKNATTRCKRCATAAPVCASQTTSPRAASTCRRSAWSSMRSEEHTYEIQLLMSTAYAVFRMKKKINTTYKKENHQHSTYVQKCKYIHSYTYKI